MQSENQEPWSQERGSRLLEDCVNLVLESVISYKSMCFDNGQKWGNNGLGLYYLWTFASRKFKWLFWSYGERYPKILHTLCFLLLLHLSNNDLILKSPLLNKPTSFPTHVQSKPTLHDEYSKPTSPLVIWELTAIELRVSPLVLLESKADYDLFTSLLHTNNQQ